MKRKGRKVGGKKGKIMERKEKEWKGKEGKRE